MVKKSNKRRMNESYGVYDLINYFDVWGNEEDGWEVNNLSRDETDIWIDDDTTDEELVDFLIDDVGFLSPSARGKVAVWNEGDMIEFEVEETGEPLCRLERTRTADGKAMGESRTRRTTKRPFRESRNDNILKNIESMCDEINSRYNKSGYKIGWYNSYGNEYMIVAYDTDGTVVDRLTGVENLKDLVVTLRNMMNFAERYVK